MHSSMSFAERQNLTMRMHMRRFTRLTNGFSKKVEADANAVVCTFVALVEAEQANIDRKRVTTSTLSPKHSGEANANHGNIC